MQECSSLLCPANLGPWMHPLLQLSPAAPSPRHMHHQHAHTHASLNSHAHASPACPCTCVTHRLRHALPACRELARPGSIPVQEFVIKSDLACGSTIGPILASGLGCRTVDVGSPQLAMHSIREMAACADVTHAYNHFCAFYKVGPPSVPPGLLFPTSQCRTITVV